MASFDIEDDIAGPVTRTSTNASLTRGAKSRSRLDASPTVLIASDGNVNSHANGEDDDDADDGASSKASPTPRSLNPMASARSMRSSGGAGSAASLSKRSDSGSSKPPPKRAASVAASGMSARSFNAISASLSVELERQTYYPGAIVRGTVRFKVKKPTRFIALRLRLSGKESMVVRMTENGMNVLSKERMTFWKQLYTLEGTPKLEQVANAKMAEDQRRIATKSMLRDKLNDTRVQTAPPGEYFYPFEVQLPFGVPPSFEEFGDDEDYAAVLYYAKAYLDIPGGGDSDLISRSFFRVVSRIGAGQFKAEARPLSDHREHVLEGCCGSAKGKVLTTVEVPRRLLSLADDKVIPFRVVVNNIDGHEPVKRIRVQLVHLLTVRAGKHEEERRTVLAEQVETRAVPPGRTDGVIGSLKMPDDPPPTVRGTLFTSEHLFIVECDVPFAFDPETRCPVTMVQVAESKEKLPKLDYETPWPQATGMREYRYECPQSREQDLVRVIGCSAGVMSNFGSYEVSVRNNLGGAAALIASDANRNGDEDDEENPLVPGEAPAIDHQVAPRRVPPARWAFVPPSDYS